MLTDPVLGRWVGALRRLVARPVPESAQRIDAVLLSHLHADHADLRSLRRVGSPVEILAPLGARGWLTRRGFTRVRELGVGTTAGVGRVRVTATDARHDGHRWKRGWVGADTIGFLVRRDCSVYYAGDTDLFPEMVALCGHVDVALLPIAGWGSSLGPGHLDPVRAAEAAALIRPAVAIPIHWGTLGLPWRRRRDSRVSEPARRFAIEAAARAPGVEVRVLEPGESTQVEMPQPPLSTQSSSRPRVR